MTRPDPALDQLLATRDPWRPASHASVGFSLNPIEDIGDVVSATGSAASSVAHAAGDVASFGAGVVGGVASAAAGAILHPDQIPGDLINIVAHPGALASPGVFAAFMTLGPVGLAYAYAADRSGATQAVGIAMDAVGGIYVDVVLKVGCAAVSIVGGMPELAFGCLLLSVAYDIAKAIVDRDVAKLVDALRAVVGFAITYGIDLNSVISATMEAVFKTVGQDIASIFGNLDTLAAAFNKIAPGLGDKIVTQIQKAAPQIEANAIKYAQQAAQQGVKTGLDSLATAVKGPKMNGASALAAGMPSGVIDPNLGIDTVGPFAPAIIRKHAKSINLVAARKDGSPVVVALVNSAMSLIRPNQIDDFVGMLSAPSLEAVARLRASFYQSQNLFIFIQAVESRSVWWRRIIDAIDYVIGKLL